MLAVEAIRDAQGVTHFYCEHHVPVIRDQRSETSEQEHAEHGKMKRGDHDLGKHAGHTPNMFRDRFLVSLILTVPVLLYSPLVSRVLGFQAPEFPGSYLISPALSTVIFAYGGFVFLKGAWRELKSGLPGMMTLISLAITVAFLYSIATLFYPLGDPLFWELTSLITIMLLGHWIEMRSVSSASGALKELAKLLPDTAELMVGESSTKTVSIEELSMGDLVLVRPGAKIPADGVIVDGKTSVNEAMVTGESLPVAKKKGSKVIAGTVNGTGALKVKVERIGEGTALAGIMRLVAEAQASRSRIQDLADRAAYYLTLVAIGVGTLTLLVWFFLIDREFAFSLQRTVAVLVITCPHALGLAIPLVTSISTTLSARSGLLIREKLALEMARNIDTVLFDKTGTLTTGELGVTDIFTTRGWDEKKALRWDASLEKISEHAIARGISKEAADRGIKLLKVESAEALPGRGISGKIQGKHVYTGGPALLEELGIPVPKELSSAVSKMQKEGKTVVYLIVSKKVVAAFGIADKIRPESVHAIARLHEMGVRVAMITGDSESVASWVARELKIDEFFAQVLPQDKEKMVRRLQEDGSRVAMVGDGINDAPALTSADVGIAIGAGTDVAVESAGIVLIKNDPRDVVKIIKLARANYRKMVENLAWATGYNVFAIPAAAGVFLPLGVVLSPAVAAILMSASTVIVAANAQALRRLEL
ncbi:heavy metal translocating P-type ATPase [Candidatus Saccharibacteria bacterium]|nr:heavy metal translocating P-type ATPase [Candidatus Saccharibacteria bacterium]